MTYCWRKILRGWWETLLDWSQTFGRVNPQTLGKATGVVTDNLGPINWIYPWSNRSMVLMIPPILLLCGWFFGLGICGPHPGYDILEVGVHPGRFLLLNPPRGLLPFLPLLTVPLAVPPVWGDSTSVLSTYMSSPSLGSTMVIIQILNDRLVLP